MSEPSERSYLPWILAALVLVVGGAKLEAARPLVARALALAIPIVPVAIGVKRLEGSAEQLERAGTIVGWVTILAGELCVAGGFFHFAPVAGALPFARLALYGAAIGALAVAVLEARGGSKARFGGFVGIAAGFAIWVSSHAGKDPFAAVFGGFFVGFFLGGGAGLLLGELLGRTFKKA